MRQAATSDRAMQNETIVERTSDRELVVTRTFNAPARMSLTHGRSPSS